MNYMPEVLKMFGVEVEEFFKIKPLIGNPYYFNQHYVLINKNGHQVDDDKIMRILTGDFEIEKIPWKPKEDDEYYIVCENENIVKCRWSSRNTNSFYRYNAGNCFKTKEEITPEIKQLILQEMKGKYEND